MEVRGAKEGNCRVIPVAERSVLGCGTLSDLDSCRIYVKEDLIADMYDVCQNARQVKIHKQPLSFPLLSDNAPLHRLTILLHSPAKQTGEYQTS
jgi:hypothetical protein